MPSHQRTSTAASARHHFITHSCTHTPCTPHQAVAARSFHHNLMPSRQRTQHGCLSSASHHHTPMHSHALHATPCRSCSLIPSQPHALTPAHAARLPQLGITSSHTHALTRTARHAACQSQVHGITPSRQAYSTQLHHRCITQSRAHALKRFALALLCVTSSRAGLLTQSSRRSPRCWCV